MKKIFLLIAVILSLSASLYLINLKNGSILGIRKNENAVSSPTPLAMPENTVEVDYKGRKYWISWMKVGEIDKLFLYPNYSEKETSLSLIEKYKCQKMVNGGFYTKDDQPLGLLISEGKKLKERANNALMNGIFFASYFPEADIAPNLPDREIRFAVQSGPILIENGLKRKIQLKSDKYARRMVVALTEQKEFFFLSLYNRNEILSGPFLSDLPEIILQFQEKTGIKFDKALNLDGGNASAFYTGSFLLEELTYIGSFFCVVN